jgi:FMN phosphatase YigB (HAD superfamily)
MFGQEQGLFANYGHDVNDTSTVTMVNIEGQKCLMTGDIDISGLTFMMENYHSEYFDVDYMTLSHHGFNTRNEFTDFCKVKTLFMPSKCILPVRKVRENAYLRSKTEESFFWGDGTKIMTFPYKVGTYESLPCKTEWIHHPDDVRPTKGGTMYTFPGRKVNTFIFNAEGFLYVDGKLREGMTDVLDYVKERGGRMLVISDKSKDETMTDLQTLGIDTYFEEVLGRDMIENEKPATDMMDLVLEKYPQEDIHRYLILTHDINDVYVANTLGLRCIIVPVDGQVDEIMDDRSWKALEKIEDIIPYFDWRKLRVE